MLSHHKATVTKAAAYAQALDLARSASTWENENDSLSGLPHPHGIPSPLSWHELLRKFSKHNPDRNVTLQAAKLERAIYLSLRHDTSSTSTRLQNVDIGLLSFPSDLLSTTNIQIPVPTSPHGADLEQIKSLIQELESTIQTPQNISDIELTSARIILALAFYVTNNQNSALRILESLPLDAPPTTSQSTDLHYKDLFLLGLILYCFCLSSSQDNTNKLVEKYALIKDFCDYCFEGRSGTTNTDSANWAEEALYYHALKNATSSSNQSQILDAHRNYVYISSKYWARSFRIERRSNIYRSYINILLESANHHSHVPPKQDYLDIFSTPSFDSSSPPSSSSPHEHQQDLSNSTATTTINKRTKVSSDWRFEWTNVLKLYEQHLCLTEARIFPRAGTINKPMLDLADRAAQGWRLGGARQDDAVQFSQLLYRTITRTFHSQRLLRHLIVALTKTKSYQEAERALELYVQLYTKASETHADKVAKEVSELQRASFDSTGDPDIVFTKGESDIDSPEFVIRTFLFGARLLIKRLKNPTRALQLADRAAKYFQDCNLNNKSLEAHVYATQGVASSALSDFDPDPETRPKLQEKSLSLLEQAVQLDPSNFNHVYHLSFLHLELRNLTEAQEFARKAARINPSRKEAWHLLALVLSAQKDLEGALNVINAALDNDDDDDVQQDDQDNQNVLASTTPNGVNIDQTITPDNIMEWDLAEETDQVIVNLQLRMTKNVVTEALLGSEEALTDLQSVFHDFAYVASQIEERFLPQDAGDFLSSRFDNENDDFESYSSSLKREGGRLSRISSFMSRTNDVNNTATSTRHGSTRTSLDSKSSPTSSSLNNDRKNPTDSLRVPSPSRHGRFRSLRRTASVRSARSEQEQSSERTTSFSTHNNSNLNPNNNPNNNNITRNGHGKDHGQSVESLGSYVSINKEAFSIEKGLENGHDKNTSTPPPPPASASTTATPQLIAHDDDQEASPSPRTTPTPTPPTATSINEENGNYNDNEQQEQLLDEKSFSKDYDHIEHGDKIAFPKKSSTVALDIEHDLARTLLAGLWLMSAATFRRGGKLDECKDAIREAESIDPSDPGVWVQLALYHMALSEKDWAIVCLQKALAFPEQRENVAARVHLASIFIEEGSTELAEGILRQVTETKGWDVVEAWHLLGKCFADVGQTDRARHCLEWALKLQDTRPIRDLKVSLPRCL